MLYWWTKFIGELQGLNEQLHYHINLVGGEGYIKQNLACNDSLKID